ncbi:MULTISPECIES: hypothetical protein [Chryseobacterium]|uniref:Uncharacterized protein n=1 Tax=Chryseobacterium camelliae TaxID=1265445 RepID=A0ABU0TFS3_9FLAO|nr:MULTISPECIES: hypothetical protein [Chryseobacterium]MDT3406334.1 hypothetical protein [Pseudacidovorax intermedius]MDQ1095867.1 hypothetical protein [Chryseobacterium camelliae]MDQ1099804.1 hypothetical protein [Chryseobacterium sp. SORGH_AS_1048]MDR6087150.1 hypothetical protein [Chryseobacterium sp. SORGH_AS_0909]MDR6131523.1 hypothetical protein [Chryseobacterium sp. SORGH_AS_1175]
MKTTHLSLPISNRCIWGPVRTIQQEIPAATKLPEINSNPVATGLYFHHTIFDCLSIPDQYSPVLLYDSIYRCCLKSPTVAFLNHYN